MEFKAIYFKRVPKSQVKEAGAEGVQIRWLINKENDGAPNFAMRLFEVEPGGYTPRHSHDWEHEVFILEGEGTAFCSGTKTQIKSGFVVFIPPNAEHYFKNTGKNTLRFLCLIPNK
ncbi:cupin domain-containing protein [Candidatus Bathyarchaeota archaeon]|nr:cupin domain-containing protein [Candidatus Bathyarchaeota archaeon]